MSRHQTIGQNNDTSIKVANKSLNNVAMFKYLGTTVTTQTCSDEESNSRLNKGMLATVQFRIFGLPVCYLETQRLKHTKL
jgi:hypothetical protein